MESLLKVRENTEKQLGRRLQEKELVFLRWVYDRYHEEKQKKKVNV
ncbi:hypothetical protein [Lentibacillus juripiscarius]|uniref:Fur-regulated basic protein FbpA n=1 Tax=Lentibacillus juripiscarius TaxID=257446 RepID=A0ABW5V7P5_9BACI